MPENYTWVIDENGKPAKCKAKPENRGKGKCNHSEHFNTISELNDYIEKHKNEDKKETSNENINDKKHNNDNAQEISQDEIDTLARKLDEIAGVKVTEENYEEVIKTLTPKQLDEINKLGFAAAPSFSLPVTDKKYKETAEANKIYFSELPNYHIGGKVKAIEDMFGSVGLVPTSSGGNEEIKSNYRDGLTAREYFTKQFSARGSQVQKTVSVSKPGHAVSVFQNLNIIRNGKQLNILWGEIQIGDMFEDGSKVTDIFSPMFSKLITLQVDDNDPITVSESHLIKAIIKHGSTIVNHNLIHSISSRIAAGADKNYVTALDIATSINSGLTVENEYGTLNVLEQNDTSPEYGKCFCIATDTGHYLFNGIESHNSARILFYGMSDTWVMSDCENDDSDGVLHCKAPGVCVKCAKKSGWNIEVGQLVGSTISTNLSEGLTQASLSAIHISGENKSKADWNIISDTLFGYSTSPIIKKAKEASTTEEARKAISDGLAEVYSRAGIKIDRYNIDMVAKKLTSYKIENGNLRMVKDDELCDLPSMTTIGGHSNIFLQAELRNQYSKFVKPGIHELEETSVTHIMS